MASPPVQGLSLAGKAVFGSLCAGTFGLGVWQTQRYFEKQALVEARQQALVQPPREGLDHHPQEQNMNQKESFRRLHLRGQYLHTAEFLVGPRGPPPGALPDKPGSSGQGMASAPQGFFVLTPFIPSSPELRQKAPLLIVNRGWVPRYMVQSDRRPGLSSESVPLLHWDRPVPEAADAPHVDVTVVPSKEECPRFLVAEHKLKERPPQLYWFDRATMAQLIGWQKLSGSPPDQAGVRLYTAVADPDKAPTWPAAPPAAAVGHFKVEPITHAGYALTWYGLSAAGLYMTRMLMTRGRG